MPKGAPKERDYSEEADEPLESGIVKDDFVVEAMNKAFDKDLNMVRDLRYDDSKMRLAANYYDFCANLAGKEVKMPFARQLWMGLHLLGEICPRCTHPNAWIMEKVPVDLDPHTLADKMQLLEYGHCRKCGVTKYELVTNGEIKDYSELVLVGGQRLGKCVIGSTQVLTSQGPMTFNELEALHTKSRGTYGFSNYVGPNLVDEAGNFVRPNKFFRAEPEKLFKVTLSTGQTIEGTPEHPIWTAQGWQKLSEIQVGCTVPIKTGQQAWGTSTDLSLEAAYTEANWHSRVKVRKPAHNVKVACEEMTPTVAGMLGYWVSEGFSYKRTHFSIGNFDRDVLMYCREALEGMFPGVFDGAGRGKPHRAVSLVNAKATLFLDLLLDGQLENQVRSAGKFIPRSVLRAPKECIQEFLRCLYEGDGGMNGAAVEYSSISKRLVQQVQVLLLNLGIPCRIHSKWSWASNGTAAQVSKAVWSLRVRGADNLVKFHDQVGFKSQRKQDLLRKHMKCAGLKKNETPAETDYVSPEIQVEWNRLLGELKEHLKSVVVYDSWGRPRTVSLRINEVKPNGRGKLRLTRYRMRHWIEEAKKTDVWNKHMPSSLQESFEALLARALDTSVFWASVTRVVRTKAQPTYDVSIPGGHRFMANGLLNHNSTFTATLVCYVTHKYFKAPRLSTVASGIQSFTPLTGSFIALTATNAVNLLWKPIRDMISVSEWFQEYFELLDDYGKQYGKELYQFNHTGTYLRLFTKGLDMYPQGPGKRTLRGPTRFVAATDELGHFPFNPATNPDDMEDTGDDERERANADEVHTVLTNSLATVRTEVLNLYKKGIFAYPQGLNLSISSPASWRDKIMRLYAESKDSTITLGIKAATWEVSPIYTRDHPIIADMYRRNPRKAERDFGANPPKLTSSVFDKDMILPMFCLRPTHRISYENSPPHVTHAKIVELNLKPAGYPPSILALDAGLTNNAFAFALLYKDGNTIKVPVALEVVAKPGSRIDFPFLYDNVLKPLVLKYNVKEVYADRWQSEFILRQLEVDTNFRVTSKQYSLKSRDFDSFIDYVPTGQLQLPQLELQPDRIEVVIDFKKELLQFPASHLFRQFLTVQQFAGMLIKGENSTDDIFRAVVLGVTRYFDTKVAERMSKHPFLGRGDMDAEAMCVVGGRSPVSLQQAMARQILLNGMPGENRD